MPRDELKQTDIYNEWYRPMRLGAAGLGVNLPTANGLPAIFGVKRQMGDDAFSGNDVAIFTALVPHLIRAAELKRLWDLNLAEAFMRGEIDSGRHGVVVVDAARHITYCNGLAERLLGASEGLRLESGALSTVDPQATKALNGLVYSCVDSNSVDRGGSVTVRRHQRLPLQLLVTPFPDGQRSVNKFWHTPGSPVAIIVISDPESERQARKSQLQSQFGLTPAEANLAIEILKGDGREAAASRLGISPGTARIHLQRVFQKTGVHRQAELVRIIGDVLD